MFAGTAVVISLLGLLLMNFAIVRGVAISASAAVLVTMLASITLLPALLGFAGHNIDRFRIPFRRPRCSSTRPIVLMVLVPATIELLGDANWWLPRVLQRQLPHFEVEREVASS